jgi:hypothetical protein
MGRIAKRPARRSSDSACAGFGETNYSICPIARFVAVP